MEIVKKEILGKVHRFDYHGFLSYLIKYNEEIRTMLVREVFGIYDVMKTELSNEYVYEKVKAVSYDMEVYERNEGASDYKLFINDIFEDLVCFVSIKDKEGSILGGISVKKQFSLYILSDSKEDIFDKYITKDTDLKKVVCMNYRDFSLTDENILDFHCVVQLDCVNDIEIIRDFDHMMYLLKNNKPYDENHRIYKIIENSHNDYLNSEQYPMDLEYELKKVKDFIASKN